LVLNEGEPKENEETTKEGKDSDEQGLEEYYDVKKVGRRNLKTMKMMTKMSLKNMSTAFCPSNRDTGSEGMSANTEDMAFLCL